ncbi:MAG: hypothetical protein QXV17_14005 [Candidatus Micrarchaeaceae archaeon]
MKSKSKLYKLLKKKHKTLDFFEDEYHNVFIQIPIADAISTSWLKLYKTGLEHELKHKLRFTSIRLIHNNTQCEIVLVYLVRRNNVLAKNKISENTNTVDEVLK